MWQGLVWGTLRCCDNWYALGNYTHPCTWLNVNFFVQSGTFFLSCSAYNSMLVPFSIYTFGSPIKCKKSKNDHTWSWVCIHLQGQIIDCCFCHILDSSSAPESGIVLENIGSFKQQVENSTSVLCTFHGTQKSDIDFKPLGSVLAHLSYLKLHSLLAPACCTYSRKESHWKQG